MTVRVHVVGLVFASLFFTMTTSMTIPKDSEKTATSIAYEALSRGLYLQTPLLRSAPLSQLVQKDVYLKLDLLQASGSFKDRGMAHLCCQLQQQGVSKLISSSGGNAGLAVATVGRQLNMSVQVVVPETTKTIVVDKLEGLGADVTVHGANWNAADILARERVEASGGDAAYISPYDNPLLWEGHSTIVDELVDELPNGVGCLVVSVGGGGLLCGVLEGAQRYGSGMKIIAAETEGASSFGQAWEQKKLVTLDAINSVATSLGALQVTEHALSRAQAHAGPFDAMQCTDEEAVDACLSLTRDHRMLVEPACGAALAVAYSPRLRAQYLSAVQGPIVIELCGGSGASVELLQQWKEQFEL